MTDSRDEQDSSGSESGTEHDNGGSPEIEKKSEDNLDKPDHELDSVMDRLARPAEDFLSKTNDMFTSDRQLFEQIEEFAGKDQRMNKTEFNAFVVENGFKRRAAAKLWARLEKDTNQTVSVALMERESKYLRALPRYVWFKFACACTWITMISAFVVFVMSLSALAAISDVKAKICSEPEIESTNKSCTEAMRNYAG